MLEYKNSENWDSIYSKIVECIIAHKFIGIVPRKMSEIDPFLYYARNKIILNPELIVAKVEKSRIIFCNRSEIHCVNASEHIPTRYHLLVVDPRFNEFRRGEQINKATRNIHYSLHYNGEVCFTYL